MATKRWIPGYLVYTKYEPNSNLTQTLIEQGSAGFLADWKAGDEMRRPPSLTVDATSDLDEKTAETAEERWRRERDDWLFGRFVIMHAAAVVSSGCFLCL